jgi:uncharacterized membrane protein YccC
MLFLCAIGIASAGNETTVTIYTDDDMKDAQEMIAATDIGVVFALVALIGQYSLPIAVILLGILAVVARMANNAEKYTWALQGIFLVIVVVFVLTIALGFITRATPDISTITFGG